jgi:ubiquinone/menaquinone biosynthesis C-methylase UbiE
MTTVTSPMIVGNVYDKFGSKNPIVRRLMARFLADVTRMATRVAPLRVLEVGCGEGHLIEHLQSHVPQVKQFCACDLSLSRLGVKYPTAIEFKTGSAYALPYDDRSFELVVCCEVLEHLEDPELAIRELYRVTSRYVLVSTPHEPWWRLLNLLRLSYLRQLGNTPGHIQHFSRRTLTSLLETQGRLLDAAQPLPWLVLLSERNDTPQAAPTGSTR